MTGIQLPQFERRAYGATPKGGTPPPAAPTADEQWHYLATNLDTIRRAVVVCAVVLAVSALAGLMLGFMVLAGS